MTSQAPAIVIDTNVVSYIERKSPIGDYYLSYLEGRRVVVCFQTVEEALFGAYRNGWGQARLNALERQLERYQVVWPDRGLVDICARLRSERRAAGRRLEIADAWIAATALYLDCPLASHDGDFDDIPQLRLVRADVW